MLATRADTTGGMLHREDLNLGVPEVRESKTHGVQRWRKRNQKKTEVYINGKDTGKLRK